jgi:hypothetical protein
MRTMAHQRFGTGLFIACLAGALAGCGGVSDAGSGTDAAAGDGRGRPHRDRWRDGRGRYDWHRR